MKRHFDSRLKHEEWDRAWEAGEHCIPPLAHAAMDSRRRLVLLGLYPNLCPHCLGTKVWMRGYAGIRIACVWCDGGEVDPWSGDVA